MAMIRIGGAEMPSPSELKVEIFDVGVQDERTADGGLAVDRIAVKRRLNLAWAHMTPAQLGALLKLVAQPLFEVTYPDPETASSRMMQCTCTGRTAGVLLIRSGSPIWTDIRLTLLEGGATASE